ncbi:hypothetical protein LIER_12751 [Lithospermum erythrorhizon]|uniref:Pectinesterase inhibitor domain-containing protein n=1 Tax=Lithospermum erythrorhizon TaxID=34254 RepID=A0AAV3PT51_LITER
MARRSLSIIFICLSITTQMESGTVVGGRSFIRTKCSNTSYPSLCFQSLSIYASTIQKSQRQLVHTSLSVSLSRAKSAQAFIYKLGKFKGLKSIEYAAIKDCIEEIGDDVDRLSQSVTELKNMGRASGSDFIWHMSNIETWVSAALTDGTTCMDGFSGRTMNARIRWSVRKRVTHVAQVTSNALALVNQYAAAN